MTPEAFLIRVINPGLRFLAAHGDIPPTDDARRFLLAVALQESGQQLDARYQGSPWDDPGPARGWWQFEQGGGVTGVLNHNATAVLASEICDDLWIVDTDSAVWRALEGNDLLSTAFARLLLFTDPYPIPTTQDEAWTCYCDRLWRPGKPHPETWPANWQTATRVVSAH